MKQVAEREGKYLVELFNSIGKQNGGKALSAKDIPLGDPFVYKHLGSMASVGRYKALVDLRQSKVKRKKQSILIYSNINNFGVVKCFWIVGINRMQKAYH